MTAKYYVRPRKEENPKKWTGPFDVSQLRDLAVRRIVSKDLHEISEDRLNWAPARQLWSTLFPKSAAAVILPPAPPAPSAAPIFVQQASVEPLPTAASPSHVNDVAEWYLASQGQQQGPFTMADLQAAAAQGQIQGLDLVWNPSLGDAWVEAQSVPAIFPVAAEPQFPQVDTAAGAKPTAGIPPLAIVSFVMSLLGATFLCGFGSLLAIVFGHVALAKFRVPQQSQQGKWMAITGLALGYAEVVLLSMIFVVTVIVLSQSKGL